MMEIHKHHEKNRSSHTMRNHNDKNPSLILPVLKGVFKNPIIIMTILGLVWNLLLKDNSIPLLISPLLTVISESFSATALFLLGLNMVGKFKMIQTSASSALMLPVVLVCVKIFVLPLVIWFMLEYVTKIPDDTKFSSMASFGFLYGTIPAAPTVFIFALHYDLRTDVVATGLVLSTLLSAPIMFICANVIRMSESSSPPTPQVYMSDLASAEMFVSIISIPCLIWTLAILLLDQKWKSITHRPTLILIIFQLMNSVGALLWNFVIHNNNDLTWGKIDEGREEFFNIQRNSTSPHHHFLMTTHYILSISGTFCCRIWTSVLALTLALLHWKSLCYVIRFRQMITTIGFLLTLVTFILVILLFETPDVSQADDPNFKIGTYQASIVIGILVPSLIITLTSIVVTQKFHSYLINSPIHLNEVDSHEVHPSHSVNGTVRRRRISELSEDLRFRRMPRRISRRSLTQRSHRLSTSSINVEELIPVSIPNDQCPSSGPCCCHTSCDARVRKYREEAIHAAASSSLSGDPSDERLNIPPVISEESPLLTSDPTDGDHDVQQDLVNMTDFHQVTSHLMLLMALFLSMMIGLIVAVGKISGIERPTGIFLELEYLDVFFNYGQGIVTFMLFGIHVSGVKRILIKLYHVTLRSFRVDDSSHRKIKLPPVDDLSRETIMINIQFVDYHLEQCKTDISYEIEFDSRRVNVFKGYDMTEWLMNAGLAPDRKNAVIYGRHLINGRTIQHLHQEQTFHDSPYLYVFLVNPFYQNGLNNLDRDSSSSTEIIETNVN